MENGKLQHGNKDNLLKDRSIFSISTHFIFKYSYFIICIFSLTVKRSNIKDSNTRDSYALGLYWKVFFMYESLCKYPSLEGYDFILSSFRKPTIKHLHFPSIARESLRDFHMSVGILSNMHLREEEKETVTLHTVMTV